MQNCYDAISEESGYRREWGAFVQIGGGTSSLGCKKLNGGSSENFEHLSIK